jgi:ubiquinone/menaquinone biosynthesis C-methylase UbiE
MSKPWRNISARQVPVDKITEAVKRRCNRIAPFYDLLVGRAPDKWWELLWSKVEGNKILEVGVGTGKSFPFYPPGAEVTAIDFSIRMLVRARAKAQKHGVKVRLLEMDVQNIEFEDNMFNTVVASLVFCSVPCAVRGLMEVNRVCKPGGGVVLLEHVLSENCIAARLMNLFNPLVFWLVGDNINRKTVQDVADSGLAVEHVAELAAGIFKLIEAKKTLKDNLDIQIITHISKNEPEYMGFHVTGPTGIIFHQFKDDGDFAKAVDNCVESISRWKRPAPENPVIS